MAAPNDADGSRLQAPRPAATVTELLRASGLMTARLLGIATVVVLFSACVSTPPVRTYADLEAAVTRMRADWQRSQLTDHPQETLITSDLSYKLFFRLPLAERAVVVMDSFASADLDGEYASTMGLMLYYRTQPDSRSLGTSSRHDDDRAYTVALFRAIESHSEEQVRRFCRDEIRYARFQRNLRRWKAYCQLSN
jgi:hypothetical protein